MGNREHELVLPSKTFCLIILSFVLPFLNWQVFFFLFRDGRESMRETEERRGKRKEGTVEEETEKHPWGLEKQ